MSYTVESLKDLMIELSIAIKNVEGEGRYNTLTMELEIDGLAIIGYELEDSRTFANIHIKTLNADQLECITESTKFLDANFDILKTHKDYKLIIECNEDRY